MKTTHTCGLLLLQRYHSPSPPLLILHHHYHHHHHRHRRHKQPPWVCQTPLQLTSLHICRSRRWDFNAESFRTQNFNFGEDEDDDDEDLGNYDILEQGFEALEDYIDSLWIFKVFRSFGWALPFILGSLILATGLKAFLMALALPIGQSTFSFAIQRMQSRKGKRRKVKNKTGSRSYARSSGTVDWSKEKGSTTPRKRKVRMGYQSWVPGNDDLTDKVEKNVPTFGGWDELDGLSELDVESSSRSDQRLGKSKNSPSENGRLSMRVEKSDAPFDVESSSSSDQRLGQSKNSPSENGRLSMKVEKSDAPLLLRLLIAVFPFLASWTKVL